MQSREDRRRQRAARRAGIGGAHLRAPAHQSDSHSVEYWIALIRTHSV